MMLNELFKPWLPAFPKLGIPFAADGGEGGGGGEKAAGEGGGGDEGGDEAAEGKGKARGGIPYARFAEINQKLSDVTDQLAQSEEGRQALQTKVDDFDAKLKGLAGPTTPDSAIDPVLKAELDQRDAAIEGKMNQRQANAWASSRPEATEDPDYQTNFAYMMRKVVDKYGVNIKENPEGVVRLAYDFYRQVWDELKAAKKDGAGAGAGQGAGGRARVGREALTPLTGGGGSDNEPTFTREQLREIGKDPARYKKMREKIWAAAKAGRIE